MVLKSRSTANCPINSTSWRRKNPRQIARQLDVLAIERRNLSCNQREIASSAVSCSAPRSLRGSFGER